MNRNHLAMLLAVSLLALAGLGLAVNRPVEAPRPVEGLSAVLPEGMVRRSLPIVGDALAELGVDAYRFVELESQHVVPVWMYAGYYAGQRTDAQIHSPEHCYPGNGYEVAASRSVDLRQGKVRELVVRRENESRLVWFVYVTRIGWTVDSFGLKRDQILAALSRRSRDALLLRVSTPLLGSESEAEGRVRLEAAWPEAIDPVLAWFGEADE